MQHLDEGTIHAWLDGALTADEAAGVERHARECKDCAALVAEARGLVAGASRILSALDEVPAGREAGGGRREAIAGRRDAEAVPANARASRVPLPASRVRLWSRPAALAAAAAVVLMAGSAVVLNKTGGLESLGTIGGDRGMTMGAASETAADTAVAASAPSVGIAASAEGTAGTTTGATARDGVARRVANVDASAPTAVPRPRRSVGVAPANQAPSQAPEARVDIARPLYKRGESYARDTARFEAAVTAPAGGAVASAMADKQARAPEKAVPLAQRGSKDVAAAPATPAPVAAALGEEGRRAAVRTMAPDRPDTIVVSRVDTVTVVVERPELPGFGAAGRAARAAQTFLTGCYEVVEGRLPRSITLTTKHAWSGTAEQRFVATAPGAIGYWSQPSTGDVHIVIAGTLVTARIDALTGDLRGKALRGGKSERFVARRGCR